MARNGGTTSSTANTIFVKPSDEYAGQRITVVLGAGQTPKPGQIVQIDPTATRVGNNPIVKVYTRDADGNRPAGPYIVLLEDRLQGRTPDTAYAPNEMAPAYIPLFGDELNLLYGNVAGTADDVVAGDLGIVDSGTGKLLVTTGSPETEVVMFLEAYTDPTADRHLWCVWSGY